MNHRPPQLEQAYRDFAAGRFHLAEVACRQVLTSAPQVAEGWVLLGLLAVKASDPNGALEMFRQAIALDPKLTIAQNNLGVLLGHRGEFEQALTCFDQAILVDPEDRAAQVNRAELVKRRQEGHSATSSRDSASVVAASLRQSPHRRSVSLTMIVRNEERNLRDCLISVASLVDEIVVVDTGSTDNTITIARELGARVISFPWIDNFAAARNAALEAAKGDWLFWLDADDRLDSTNQTKLRQLLTNLPETNTAFVMACRCPQRERADTLVDHVRLFRRLPDVRWEYRVHEQILASIRRIGGDVVRTDIVIDHVGYQDEGLQTKKLQRNRRLLELDLQNRAQDPFVLYNLGHTLFGLQQVAEAVSYAREGLRHSMAGDPTRRPLGALLARCYRNLGQPAEAVAICQSIYTEFVGDVELLYEECQAQRQLGNHTGAEACLREIISSKAEHFASIPDGSRGHLAHHNLAVLCWEQNRYDEAEVHWRQALSIRPNYLASWQGLGMLYLKQQRWADLEPVAVALEKFSATPETARELREQISRVLSK